MKKRLLLVRIVIALPLWNNEDWLAIILLGYAEIRVQFVSLILPFLFLLRLHLYTLGTVDSST